MDHFKQEALRLLNHAIHAAAINDRAEEFRLRAALLAHIERGQVPEGWRDAMRRLTFAARTTGGTAGQDADLMAACDVCEALLIAAAPAAPDQFRDAAKLMPAEVPMPESVGGTFIDGLYYHKLYSKSLMQQYGDACEAAGYARGLRDAVRDAAPLVQNGEVLVTVTGLTGSGKSAIAGEIEIMCRALGLEVEWGEGAADKHLTHADWTNALEMYRPRVRIVEANIPRTDAALRGEVKP